MTFEYFASGTNEPGQIWGFARIGHPLGVAADECLSRRGCEEALLEIARAFPSQRVFIDSGAFSEVEFVPGKGLVPVHPISNFEWRRRLAFMQRIADAYGPRALIIAPDQIGSQDVTLQRLELYREKVLDLVRAGAEVAIVLQGGERGPGAFEDAAAGVLGWAGFVRAFPMKKGATRGDELRAYLERRRPARIHLLGVGPRSKGNKREGRASAKELQAMFAEIAPSVDVSWDSCLIAASVGRDKPGGRPLTRAQDIQAIEVGAEAFHEELRDPYREMTYDWTEVAGTPSVFLQPLWGGESLQSARESAQAKPGAHSRRRLAAAEKTYLEAGTATGMAAGLGAPEARRFAADPDSFIHEADEEGRERWERDERLMDELERAYHRWVLESSAQLRKERAIVGAFGKPAAPAVAVTTAPKFHPKSGRLLPGERIEGVPVGLDPGEPLARYPRGGGAPTEVSSEPQQLTLLNARHEALKRKLMR